MSDLRPTETETNPYAEAARTRKATDIAAVFASWPTGMAAGAVAEMLDMDPDAEAQWFRECEDAAGSYRSSGRTWAIVLDILRAQDRARRAHPNPFEGL